MKKISQPQLKYCGFLLLPALVASLVAFFLHPYVWLLIIIIVFTLAFDVSIAYFGIKQKCYEHMAVNIVGITVAAAIMIVALYAWP